MEEKKYKIELTEKEAGNFLMWREYQDLWERLPFFRCQTLWAAWAAAASAEAAAWARSAANLAETEKIKNKIIEKGLEILRKTKNNK